MKKAIEVKHLSKYFQENEVIKECSMSIDQGTIYGLLGVNGVGKTTLFKLLTGLLCPENGSIDILGSNMLKNRDTLLSKMGILIESPTFYEHLSAQKNLELHLAYMETEGIGIDKALHMVGLQNISSKPVSTFSLGMRQRLGIARAIIHQPKLLILDEPINGLDPIGIKQMRELFLKLVKENEMTILLSSHILSEIEHIADTIGVMSEGKIIHETHLLQIKKEYQGSLEDYFFTLMAGGQ